MHRPVIKIAFPLSFLAILLFFIAAPVHAQSVPAVSGRWMWKEVARKHKPQTQFTVVIQRKGDVVLGTYSVDEFIDGKWQGEDGNQTPFRGRVTPQGVEIEFDPSAVAPGYEQDVRYKAPADGRKPSVAVLTLKGRTLLWNLVRGKRIDGVPSRVTLNRDRRRN